MRLTAARTDDCPYLTVLFDLVESAKTLLLYQCTIDFPARTGAVSKERNHTRPEPPIASQNLIRTNFIGDLESLAITCVHGDADKRIRRGRWNRTPKPHTSLLLESIALRHQTAVLDRSGTRRPCFRLCNTLRGLKIRSPWWRYSREVWK
jgi:hypothetical protein